MQRIINEETRNRYSNALPRIQHTLPKLLTHLEFLETINTLRAEGWKDWHLLCTITSITVMYRVQEFPESQIDPEIMKDLMLNMMYQPELESWSLVPLTEYTEEKMRISQKVGMISTLLTIGLECRQVVPDLDAIEHFLRERYNYWEIDVDHDEGTEDIKLGLNCYKPNK